MSYTPSKRPDRDVGIEWLGKLPSEWDVLPIRRIFEVVNGGTPKSDVESYWGGGIPWVTPDDLGKSDGIEVETTRRSLTRAGYDACGASLVPPRSIVISTRAPVGYVAIAGTELCTNQGCRSLIPRRDLGSYYFFFQLSQFSEVLDSLSAGSTFKELSTNHLSEFPLAVPPFSEQFKIGQYLVYATARIDRLIEKQERLIELLDEKRQAVISHAVTKGLNRDVSMKDSGVEWLGKVPAHWDVAKIRWVAQLESGHTPSRNKPEYWENCDIPWMTLSDIWQVRKEARRYIVDTAEKVSQLGLDKSSARLLPKGTVVLSRTASVGYPAIMGRDMATTQDFANWVCGDKIKPEYLYFVLKAMKSEFDRLMRGSTHKTIYMPDIHELVTPVPGVSEQDKIVSYIERRLDGIHMLRQKLQKAIELLSERRSAVISAAVTGKIDVRDWKLPESANQAEEGEEELLEAAEQRAGYG